MTDPGGKETPPANQQDKGDELAPKNKSGVDWGQLTVDALNRHTNDPAWSARYMRWLETIGPNSWTPVSQRDYEQMKAEGIKPAPAVE